MSTVRYCQLKKLTDDTREIDENIVTNTGVNCQVKKWTLDMTDIVDNQTFRITGTAPLEPMPDALIIIIPYPHSLSWSTEHYLTNRQSTRPPRTLLH